MSTTRSPRRRHAAVLLTLALVASACSSSGDGPADDASPSSTNAVDVAVDVEQMAFDSLGAPQAVQDFIIRLDMMKYADDGSFSFYQDVLDHAADGAGEAVDLAGGFGFTPVTSLEGAVFTADGDPMPTISLDFGLLRLSDALFEQTRAQLVADLDPDGAIGFAETLEDLAAPDTELLIEIVTADLAARRTHVDPGDLARVDLSFVDPIALGDDLRSTYLFGQTLPGSLADEEGLDPHELFIDRWQRGLVALMSGPADETLVLGQPIEISEGSTPRRARGHRLGIRRGEDADAQSEKAANHQVKQQEGFDIWVALLIAANKVVADSFDDALRAVPTEVEVPLGVGFPSGMVVGLPEYGPQVLVVSDELGRSTVLLDDDDPRLRADGCFDPPGCEIPAIGLTAFLAAAAVKAALETCNWLVSRMNVENRKLGVAAIGAGRSDPFSEDEGPERPCLPEDPDEGGGAFGDIHMQTFDGLFYSNQAAGEFLIFENDVTEIQLRTEPMENVDTASVGTAIAVRVGDQAVSMHGDGSIWIDDEPADLPRGEAVDLGEAGIVWTGFDWAMTWVDGTAARITPGAAVSVVIVPVGDAAGGMLGDNDGDPDNDVVARDGRQLLAGDLDDVVAQQDEFVDTWRISADESLFHYAAGESTESFTIEDFPVRPITAEDLEPGLAEGANEVCASAGITRQELLDACMLDLGLSLDPQFVFDALTFQTRTPPAVSRGAQDGSAANVVSIGDFSLGFGPNPPVVDATGFRPAWSCEATEESFALSNRFPESTTRRYELTISYHPSRTAGGDARFSLVIERNGSPYAWVSNTVEHFAEAIDDIALDGDVLTVRGSAFLNEPPDDRLLPASVLPAGATLVPFSLRADCSG